MAGRPLNVAELILADAAMGREKGDRVAVREPTRLWTYRELEDVVARLGGALTTLGVGRGDRVAVLMPDGLEAAASILAAIYIGAVAVPLSELGRANDIRALVRDSGAKVALVHVSLEPVLDEVRGEMPGLLEVVVVGGARAGERSFETIVAEAEPAPPAATGADDIAVLLYSGAPNDRPRGVAHTHETPLHTFQTYGQGVLELSPADKVFSVARLPSAYGLGAGLFFPLLAGAESIFLPGQPHSRQMFDMLFLLQPTVLFATPSLYSQLVADAGRSGASALFGSLRACVSGAETMPARLFQRIKIGLGVEVLGGFGLTEAFHFVIATPPGRTRAGSAGLVLPGFDVRLVGENGAPVGIQEIGTLEVRGPTVASGYWNRTDDTGVTFGAGWVRTVDRFLRDQDGYFFHCGRTDDLFKVGGKWVSPTEIERTLLAHGAVWECAVVGVDDENGLTKPVAFVVPNVGQEPGEALERELIEYVKREIAPYKYPRWIEFVAALPKGPHGKVLRYKLHFKPRKKPTPTLLPNS